MTDSFSDQIRKFTDGVVKKLESLEGTHSIVDILDPAFMRAHTSFGSFEAMCEAVGVRTAEEFTAMPNATWEAHVQATTNFPSWDEMQRVAGNAFVARQLKE